MRKGFLLLGALVVVIAGVTIYTNTREEKCIITVFGRKYNVQLLRAIHPGGDIYVCGEDMSETFKKQHGEDVERIKKYLLN